MSNKNVPVQIPSLSLSESAYEPHVQLILGPVIFIELGGAENYNSLYLTQK